MAEAEETFEGLPCLKCAGYLAKRGQKNKRWCKRWCIFQSGVIKYYTEKNGKLQGVVNTTLSSKDDIQILESPEPSCKIFPNLGFSFHVRTPQRTWLFVAQTEEERKLWIETISKACATNRRRIIMEGVVEKQGGMIKNWKSRWLVQDSLGVLYYYVDDSLGELQGQIDLLTATEVSLSDNSDEIVLLTKSRTWKFRGVANREGWVDSLETAIHRYEQLRKRLESLITEQEVSWSQNESDFRKVWGACYPDLDFPGPNSKQWKKCGFQSYDPTLDFRGLGYFSLQTLVHFAETRPKELSDIVQRIEREAAEFYYPRLASFCALLYGLYDMLLENPSFQRLFLHETFEVAFKEVFVVFYIQFDMLWRAKQKQYMQFQDFQKEILGSFRKILDDQPGSINALKTWITSIADYVSIAGSTS